MKNHLLSLLLLLTVSLSAQQAKQVYITLDVSRSMYGAKYELANYTTQMIVSMCEAQDDIYIIVTGKRTNLSRQSKVLENSLQYSLPMLPLLDGQAKYNSLFNLDNALNYRDYEIRDIITFNKVYQPSKKKENWIFIIGDGRWEDAVNQKFKEIVERGTLNVCYLQTGDFLSDDGDFTQFARTLGVVDIRKSDTDPSSIKVECDHFARKILGFSNVSPNLTKTEPNEVVFTLKFPVSEFLIVYQDNVPPMSLPKINHVNANGQLLNYQLKGTPSTYRLSPPLNSYEFSRWPSHVILSGNVWRAKAKAPIPAGQSVTVSFDKDIDINNVRIYPICKDFSPSDFNPVPITIHGQLDELKSGTYAICREKDKATIIISLSDKAEQTIPEELLKASKVKVIANNIPYTATYENGHFTCDIKLTSDETKYNAEIDIPDYNKSLTTPFQTIVKSDNCIEEKKAEKQKKKIDTVPPPIPLGEVQFQQHMVLKFTLSDKKTKMLLNPNDFDLNVTLENGYLFEEPKITVRGDTVYLFIDAKEDWCECLLPEELNGKITATPKKGVIFENGKVYSRAVYSFHATLKRNTWFVRCQWVLYLIGGLLLCIIYLRLMLRKNRFKKNAMIIPYVWVKTKGEYIPMGGYRLRKKGFAAWFSRWFLPFDEKRSIAMHTPLANFNFVASESRSRILFPKTDFDNETMIVTGYDPAYAKKKDPYIKLSDGGIIEISKVDGIKDGKLQFVAGKRNDEGFYHFFLGLLVFADIAAICFLIYLMARAAL